MYTCIYKWHVCPGSYNLKLEMSVGKRAWKEVKKQVRKEMRMEVGKEVGKKLEGKEMRMDVGKEVGGRRGRKWGKR